MSEPIRVLVVDDHQEIRTLIAEYLTKHELRVQVANGGEQMRKAMAAHKFDVVVLDLMMPGEDGLALCRQLRETSRLPVIMLTALGEEADRIIGLEMGADDYITKPFSARELLARIKVVVRRAQSMPYFCDHQEESERLQFGDWTLDQKQRELLDSQGRIVSLSSGEYRLLNVFLKHPKHVLNRDQLMELTRGHNAGAFDRSIDNHISRLRKKIEVNPKQPEIIKTVWGGGYMLTEEVT